MSENKSNNDNLKNALCYAPFVAIILFFTEDKKSNLLMKHIRYGLTLFVVYIVLNIFVGGAMGGALFLLYVGIISFLGFKAYNGEDVKIECIDKLESKIKESMDTKDDVKK